VLGTQAWPEEMTGATVAAGCALKVVTYPLDDSFVGAERGCLVGDELSRGGGGGATGLVGLVGREVYVGGAGRVGGGLSVNVCRAGTTACGLPAAALAGRTSRPHANAAQPTAAAAGRARGNRPGMSNRVLKSGILLDRRKPQTVSAAPREGRRCKMNLSAHPVTQDARGTQTVVRHPPTRPTPTVTLPMKKVD
jgi:hypothetical protein